MSVQQLFLLSILLYVAGAVASLVLKRAGKIANYAAGISAFVAGGAGMASAVAVLARGAGFTVEAVVGVIPFAGFTLQVDLLAAFMVLVISLLAAATALYSLAYQEECVGRGAGVLGFLQNIFLASMVLVVTSGNAFYFLLFWELMSLASYFLVSFAQDQEAVEAGFLYFLVSHVGTALIMLAFFVFFLYTGSFDFASFRSANLPPAIRNLLFLLAFFGFGAKAGIMPLHIWLPRAYPAAPAPVSALLSGATSKTAIYGLLRVSVDFLGASGWWWGLAVLAFGAISAVLGVLYAVGENNLQRLVAYSSIENVGIILLGVGAGMVGVASGQPVLGVLGILAGLYHVVNHAVFKGLLFLGAGSVNYRLHTSNMEEMGGLARQMPWTGLAFLTGVLGIAALPPFNGFVSEWLIYQALFKASTGSLLAVKALAPLLAIVLALASALAALCFVKAYGVTFAGPGRSKRAEEAREVPAPMLIGMGMLAVGCLALGLGAPLVAPYLGEVASALLHTSPVPVSDGLLLFPASSAQAVLSTPLMALLLVGLASLPLLIVGMQGGMRAGRRSDATPWACGYKYSLRMVYASAAFAQPLRVLFHSAYGLRTALAGPGYALASYCKGAVGYLARVESMWEDYLYAPLVKGTRRLGEWVQALQIGNVRMYCLYIIVTLVVLLLATVR